MQKMWLITFFCEIMRNSIFAALYFLTNQWRKMINIKGSRQNIQAN